MLRVSDKEWWPRVPARLLLEWMTWCYPLPEDCVCHGYHQYTVRVKHGRRDALRARLAEAGIGTMVYYPVPVHRLPVYDWPMGSLPQAEAAAEEVVALPMGAQIRLVRLFGWMK